MENRMNVAEFGKTPPLFPKAEETENTLELEAVSVISAWEDMKKFGEHEGACVHDGPSGSCSQHVQLTATRMEVMEKAVVRMGVAMDQDKVTREVLALMRGVSGLDCVGILRKLIDEVREKTLSKP